MMIVYPIQHFQFPTWKPTRAARLLSGFAVFCWGKQERFVMELKPKAIYWCDRKKSCNWSPMCGAECQRTGNYDHAANRGKRMTFKITDGQFVEV